MPCIAVVSWCLSEDKRVAANCRGEITNVTCWRGGREGEGEEEEIGEGRGGEEPLGVAGGVKGEKEYIQEP